MHSRPSFILALIILLSGCVSGERASLDSDYNYSLVFQTMTQPKPVIVNSRLERYSKDFGLWNSSERNGEWEFEIIGPKEWVEEVKRGFVPTTFEDTFRRPSSPWWNPSKEKFDAFQMPYSSYAAAHLYIEKSPKDPNRIHVFIQRH